MRGYALDPSTEPNLFTVARVGSVVEDIRGDIRDASTLDRAIKDFAPKSSSTSPPSPSCATPTKTPSGHSKPT